MPNRSNKNYKQKLQYTNEYLKKILVGEGEQRHQFGGPAVGQVAHSICVKEFEHAPEGSCVSGRDADRFSRATALQHASLAKHSVKVFATGG